MLLSTQKRRQQNLEGVYILAMVEAIWGSLAANLPWGMHPITEEG